MSYKPQATPQRIAKVNYTHDAMIDLILQNPAINTEELAVMFGYSRHWVCRILASDAFQARLADRRREIVDPLIRRTVNDRMKKVVIQGMEVVSRKMDDCDSAEIALEALGVASRALNQLH